MFHTWAFLTLFFDLGIPTELVEAGPHYYERDPTQLGFGVTVLPGPTNPNAPPTTFLTYQGSAPDVDELTGLWAGWCACLSDIPDDTLASIRQRFFPHEEIEGRPGYYRSSAVDEVVSHLRSRGHLYPATKGGDTRPN